MRHVFTSAGDPALFTARFARRRHDGGPRRGVAEGRPKALDAGGGRAGGGGRRGRRLQVAAVRLHDGAASVGGRARRPADHRGRRHLRRAVGRGGGGAGRRGRPDGYPDAREPRGGRMRTSRRSWRPTTRAPCYSTFRQPRCGCCAPAWPAGSPRTRTASPLLGGVTTLYFDGDMEASVANTGQVSPASSTSCRSPRSSAAPGRAPGKPARGRGPARRTVTGKAAYAKRSVRSRDGTTIGFRQLGAGPALVLLHGGALASQHYMKLGNALADAFTVCIPDRRGRWDERTVRSDHSIEREDEDPRRGGRRNRRAVRLRHRGRRAVRAARLVAVPQIRKVAVFEPGSSSASRALTTSRRRSPAARRWWGATSPAPCPAWPPTPATTHGHSRSRPYRLLGRCSQPDRVLRRAGARRAGGPR